MSRLVRHRSHGQGLVEFALILPVLLILLLGILDFGRAIYAYNTLSNASRAGVRVAIVNQNGAGLGCVGGSNASPGDPTMTSPQDCAEQAAVVLGGATATVTYRNITDTAACSPVQVGCLAVVTTSYTFTLITPIISNIVGSSIVLSSTSKEPVEFICPQTAAVCVPGQ